VCKVSFLLLALVAVVQFGCRTAQQPVSVTQSSPSNAANQAHALLFGLLGDERNVSKLLIIKRERPEMRALIQEISERAGKAHKELEAFAKSDRTLNLKDQGLPNAEVHTRNAIAKARAKELLTESGKEFELRLLLTQNEALTYGAYLAATAAASDTDPARRQMLQQLSTDLLQLQKKTGDMLLKNYTRP
jgi:hypothetical protein